MSEEAGAELRARVQGARHEELRDVVVGLDPQLATWMDGWIFGEVWDTSELSFEDRLFVAIISLAATDKPAQLRAYLHGAVQSDEIDPNRIHAALKILPVYVGFPTALQAFTIWQEVVRSARKRGITVEVPVT